MNRNKLMPNAMFIFIFSIVALVSSFVLYIYWYIEISSGLDEVINKFDIDPRQVFESQTGLVIFVLAVLVGLILTGLSMTFVYNQKMQQLYRLQNNFINNFTHELKTPVTSLKLYLETFQKHEISKEDQRKYIDYMLQDVNRLSDNISNILDLGRIESRNFQDEFESIDLFTFVDGFYAENKHLFPGLSIRVSAPEGDDQRLDVSRPLFEMLLINMASNAFKYNDSSEPCLDVRMDRQGSSVIVRFTDNGIGIDRSQSKKIFKKFYQVGHSSVRSAQGSGLGLYFVQNIVLAHGGKIKVVRNESDPLVEHNKGATFILTLPLNTKKSAAKRKFKLQSFDR